MDNLKKFLEKLHPLLLSSIASVLTVAQILLAFFVHGETTEAVQWAGWICIWVAGIFGVLPVITFRLLGGVAKGESYMKTTQLVDSGIYAIVRHPQGGTAWLLICLGVMVLAWHWTSVVLGGISMLLAYVDTFKSDQECIEKFGEDYRTYMQRVPRVNFLAGLLRLVGKRS